MSQRIKFSDFETGVSIPELRVGPVEHMDLVRYAGASGDFNPIHLDPDFAKKVGLEGTIVHGMYVMAQLGRLLTNWADPAQIQSFGVKFKGMIIPGDTMVCQGIIKNKKEEENKKLISVAVQATVNEEVRVSGDAVLACD